LKSQSIQFHRIFPDLGFSPNHEGVITIASLVFYDRGHSKILVGFSYKKPGEKFVKKVGNAHAVQRMMTGSSFLLPSCFHSVDSIRLWTNMISLYLIGKNRKQIGSVYEEIRSGIKVNSLVQLSLILGNPVDLDLDSILESLMNGIQVAIDNCIANPGLDPDCEISGVYFYHVTRYNDRSHPGSIDLSSIESI